MTNDPTAGMTLRERNRLLSMQHVQDVAFALFGERGYDDVTVADVAAAAGTSPATIYRHFGTKEQLVVWKHGLEESWLGADRLDAPDDVFGATKQWLLDHLVPMYATERDLARLNAIFSDPVLGAIASTADTVRATESIEQALAADPDLDEVEVTAFVLTMVAIFSAALRCWAATAGAESLEAIVERSFSAIAMVGAHHVHAGS